jgi:outer membrane immunogenic protein
MSKKLFALVAVAVGLSFVVTATSLAQYKEAKSYLGPRLGLGVNGSSFSVGAGYEYGVTPDISVGALLDYYQWSYTVVGNDWKETYVVFGAQGNYHFGKVLKWDNKLDPFAGLVLGYQSISWSGTRVEGRSANPSGLVLGGQAGLRYFVSPTVALYGQAGFGITYLKVGVDFVI